MYGRIKSVFAWNDLMYGILDRYVGKNIVFSVVLVSVCLTLFAGLINLIDALRYIGRGDIDFGFVLVYTCYRIPIVFVQFFPVSILIGGVIGLGMMARNSEIIILQSIGLSKLNIGISCIKSLIPVIMVVIALSETAIPKLDKHAEDEYYRHASASTGVSVTTSGAWIKEGDSFIGICAMINRKTIAGVSKYEYEGTKLKSFSKAATGNYVDNHWVMNDVVEQVISDDGVTYRTFKTQIWPLSVNLERIEILSEISDKLSVLQLHDYINYIEQNGVDSARYRLSFYNKLLSPVIMLVMLLLALSTIFGPLRSMNMGTRILSGIALGFGYYVLNQIVAPFSIVYGVPPILGATFATAVFLALAIYLLKRKS